MDIASVAVYSDADNHSLHVQQADESIHLGPAPAEYLTQVVSEIGKLNPDVLIPMHCSGLNFTQEAQRQMPGKVLTTTTGTSITFGI